MDQTHICQGCGHHCPRVHPFCLFCRSGQRASVETFVRCAEAAVASEGAPVRISPVIVREIDAILARHNRQEKRARRRSRKSDRVLVYLGWSLLAMIACIVAFVLGGLR